MTSFAVEGVQVRVFPRRSAMGRAAAEHVMGILEQLQTEQDELRIVVGSAPSQDEFFHCLTDLPLRERVDWSKVVVFHMDEYVGLSAEHPQSFRRYQFEHFVSKVRVKQFHGIEAEHSDPESACRRYGDLLAERPIDLVCLGIGENGHLAFNDPPVADFEDSLWAKIVELDFACRRQQVNDGCFSSIEKVPRRAITVTLRVFATARHLSGVVPGARKAAAVAAALEGPVSTACPASLLRKHPEAHLFLDAESASHLSPSAPRR